VNGQEARKASAGSRDLADPVEAFAKPVVVLDTPSTQAWASDASIASFAGQDFSLISQGDLHETAAHTHATVAGQTASFYTHNGGIKAFAANGPVSLRAHTDELQILADKDVTVISVNGEIHINAQSKIEIIGADSSIVLDGGNITFTTPGTWAAKASAAAMLGGGNRKATFAPLPSELVTSTPLEFINEEIVEEHYLYVDRTGTPVAGINYTLTSSTHSANGKTSLSGETEKVRVKKGGKSKLIAWRDKLSPRRNDGGN
jgi:type VI secretion system secreted protein VgrG